MIKEYIKMKNLILPVFLLTTLIFPGSSISQEQIKNKALNLKELIQ